MTAGVIPDVAITADVITTAADAAITVAVADGELPCLAAETAAPAFSGSSAFCAAAAITDAVITMAVAMTAAGSSSFFCFCAEMDAAATIAADLLKRQRSFPLPFLLPFFCFLLFLFFLFQTFQIYLIKRISINDKFLFFFRFHNHIPLKNFFYI